MRAETATGALLILALLLGACTAPEPQVARRDFFAMGTLVSVSLAGLPAERAEALFDAVEADFAERHRQWHAWEESPLVRLNRALPSGDWVPLDPVLTPLMAPAIRLSVQSEHLFNPAIGRLIALWGFHNEAFEPKLPDPDAIRELVAADPRMTDLELDGERVRSRNPAVQLDFGGFAKGYTLDEVIEALRREGAAHAVVNAGGDLRAIGRHGDRPWRIGIRHPRADRVLGMIEVSGDESVFTSGDYERGFEIDGRRYHHIIDPRTGWPATGSQSVTVLHRSAAVADAAATALFVAGPRDWRRIARRMGIEAVLLIDAEGRAHLTPAMAARVRFAEPPPPSIVEALDETPRAQ
ncbi:FAD:protein FMN transferase [Thiohalobacter sp.]|uniref:FAD:protein FMN transferase n=1 Tax=Thiohalobacter sp. TaxID=2025948 RepID=UPI002637ECC8|nr:FAD:protein FMN transferase [Thiohalobacter sp.]